MAHNIMNPVCLFLCEKIIMLREDCESTTNPYYKISKLNL